MSEWVSQFVRWLVGWSVFGEPLQQGGANNYFTEMRSGSEAGSYLRLIYCVYHSTPGLRVIKKKTDLSR